MSLYLLARSREALAEEPERAEELAATAAILLSYEAAAPDRKVAGILLARAWCVIAQSRLQRQAAGVEAAFDDAALYLSAPFEGSERGRFCRALAQLRWQQGRLEEALALLRRGAEVFAELGLAKEEAASLCLIGLLRLEQGDAGGALAALARGRRALTALSAPWLALRTDLAMAFCWAEQGENKQAERLLAEAEQLFPLVQDPGERLRLTWWVARVGTRLGQPCARNLLETLLAEFLRADLLPEVALVALDMALAAAEAGDPGHIGWLEKVLATSFGETKGKQAPLTALRRLVETAKEGGDLRQEAAELAAFLRRTFRFHGYRVEPLPPL